MLHSMTGFGDAQHEEGGVSFVVEIKTLNNRFLKTSFKISDALSFVEPEVDRMIRQELSRGSVSYSLHMRYIGESSAFEVNQTAVQEYMSHLEQILTLHGKDKNAIHIDLASLLQLPGICQLREYSEEKHQKFMEITQKLTQTALQRLRKMRADEGREILADLQQKCQDIRQNLDALNGLSRTVVDQYRKRIQQRVNEMLSEVNLSVDEDLLIKEIAVFAERCDINEEVSRLESHLKQFEVTCQTDEQAGRRLDFLSQEMLREANTIASKANNAQISQHIVEIKVAIDRLREQVQNVE